MGILRTRLMKYGALLLARMLEDKQTEMLDLEDQQQLNGIQVRGDEEMMQVKTAPSPIAEVLRMTERAF